MHPGPDDMSPGALDFVHRFEARPGPLTLLLLHGTGGNEDDLLPLGRHLAPDANLLSPRGKVLENGMPRFFRRLAMGVFDVDDLRRRTQELGDFVAHAARVYGFATDSVVAVGYSNGANIAASLLLLRPEVLRAAALLHAMVPLEPDVLPDLGGTDVLVTGGMHDPMVPGDQTEALARMLSAAGADVELEIGSGGHELTPRELEVASRWVAGVPGPIERAPERSAPRRQP